jgi:hypothetical protein
MYKDDEEFEPDEDPVRGIPYKIAEYVYETFKNGPKMNRA